MLDYHSLFQQEPEPAPVVPWVPPRRKQEQKVVITASIDAVLPGVEADIAASVHNTGSIDARLPDVHADVVASGGIVPPTDLDAELLILVAGLLLEEDDELW